MRVLVALAAVAMLATGCSGGDDGRAAPRASSPAGPAASATAAAPSPSATPTRATAAPQPSRGACYRLSYDGALAPSSGTASVRCAAAHTSQTFAVPQFDAVVEGHLLAVDSDRVQSEVAQSCPQKLAGFLGGTEDERRLTVLRTVWFTPTVAESDAGAQWYRCDVIAVAAEGMLAVLPGHLQGLLDRPEGRDAFGMCGTAEPGAPTFERVICSSTHTWRAIATVALPPGKYPGIDAARDAGQTPCKDAGRNVAADATDFQWGYEWPTRKQWRAGQTYGLCWAPD